MRLTVDDDYYSTLLTSPETNREAQAPCPDTHLCLNGTRYQKVEIASGCPGGSVAVEQYENLLVTRRW